MIVDRKLPLWRVLSWTRFQILWLSCWMTIAACIFQYSGLASWFGIPLLPISLIGTAVAFYVGFKNNSAYDRMWEARKIWGAIVNSSRSWGSFTKSFVSNQFRQDSPVDAAVLKTVQQRLIYRHIAWLYTLRCQLLAVKVWEHASSSGLVGRRARYYQKEFGVGLVDDAVTQDELKLLLPPDEYDTLINYKNTATQIIDRQSADLQDLRQSELIDDFRHMELQNLLSDLYIHQGKAERIKNFPLPRQYASSSSLFVGIFIGLLPFGMASEFAKLSEFGVWWSIPFSVLVGWVFVTMELVGDYSENPFQGISNDIPMLSLCRTIEIDLREMLGETDLPESIQPTNGVLM